jgi:SAM-dependent methyltransferase
MGCGAQPFRRLLPQGIRYRGIDTIDAKTHFGYSVPDTLYFEGDRWPVEDRAADVILCTEVLEHVFDVETFLNEAHRCLRPGGTLVLTVPFAARWHYTPHDYWRFTPSSLVLLLGKAGLTDARVYQRGNPMTVAAYKAMALLLPIIMPQTKRVAPRLALLLPGVVAIPVLASLALIAQLSLAFDYGDDCLGYTLVATRAGERTQTS